MITPTPHVQSLPLHYFNQLNVEIARLRASGKNVIRLDIGSPDLPPAAHIIASLIKGAREPTAHGYQAHNATPELRRAWAHLYQRLYALELDPDSEVLPLIGSKEGIFHLMQAFLTYEDVVLVPNPGYVTYTRGAEFAGAQAYPLPLTPEQNYLPDLTEIPPQILERAKILWLNYPHNPTAAVANSAFFAEVVAFAHRFNLLVCHDAAYCQVTFNGRPAPSILQIPGAKETAVEFNTLSKSHNMAGWRVAALVGNPSVVKTLLTLKSNQDSGHFLPILEAATTALTADQSWLHARNEVYRQRRDIVIDGLRACGLQVATPQASIYVWSPLPPGFTSEEFTLSLLRETGVSVTPGTVFGAGGEGYLRISLTAPEDKLKLAMDLFKDWVLR